MEFYERFTMCVIIYLGIGTLLFILAQMVNPEYRVANLTVNNVFKAGKGSIFAYVIEYLLITLNWPLLLLVIFIYNKTKK